MSQKHRIAQGRIAYRIATFSIIALSSLALLGTLLVGPGAGPASAQTVRMGGGSSRPGGGTGPSGPPRPLFRPAPPVVVNSAPSVVYQPRFFYRVPFNQPYGRVPTYGVPVVYGPFLNSYATSYWTPSYLPGPYVAPSYGQWVPGYWTYTWVPQGSATNVWVPGYYDKDGVWVAGYNAAQVTQSGYYQPYWVSGYWAP